MDFMKKIRWKIILQKNYIPNSNFWTWIQFKWSQIHKIKHKFWFWHPKPTNLAHISYFTWNVEIRHLSFEHWSFVNKAIYFLSSFLSTYIWFGELQSHFSPLFFLNAALKIFILWHRRNEPMIYGLRIESETSMSIFYGRARAAAA